MAHRLDGLQEAAPIALAAVVVSSREKGHLEVVVPHAYRGHRHGLGALGDELWQRRQGPAKAPDTRRRRVVVRARGRVLGLVAAEKHDRAEASKVEILRVLHMRHLNLKSCAAHAQSGLHVLSDQQPPSHKCGAPRARWR